ncbi:10784_t:CDS:2 [Acaulospora morrowiae]|uniref:10784_t:CDS:1 n=1 Tax=Acaulospora morrowiae TaxID=94023 RepID=A0A9N8V5H5_9GLOM|nr:10784_t:CDS:2 [Acaulospora morrowiae]
MSQKIYLNQNIEVKVELDNQQPTIKWFKRSEKLKCIRIEVAVAYGINQDFLKFKIKKMKKESIIDHDCEANYKLKDILHEDNVIYLSTILPEKSITVRIDGNVVDNISLNPNVPVNEIRRRIILRNLVSFPNFIFRKKGINSPEILEHEEESVLLRNILDNDNNLYISLLRSRSQEIASEIRVCVFNNDENGLMCFLDENATLSQIRSLFEKKTEGSPLYMGSNYYFVINGNVKIDKSVESREILKENISQKKDIYVLNIMKTDEIDWIRLSRMCENGFKITKDDTVTKRKWKAVEKAPEQAFKIKIETEDIMPISDDELYRGDFCCDDELDDLCKRNLITYSSASAVLPWLPLFLGISYEKSNHVTNLYKKRTEYSILKIEKKKIKISNIELSQRFIDEVKIALGENTRKRKLEKLCEVSKNYGHFYAEHIIFGGAVVTRKTNREISKNKFRSQKFGAKILAGAFANLFATASKEISSTEMNSEATSYFQIFGGDKATFSSTNYTPWIDSLKDQNKWGIVGFDNIHSIFDLLEENLKRGVLEIFGQIIRDVNICNFTFELNLNKNTPVVFNLHEKLDFDANINQYKIYISIMSKEEDIFSSRVHYDEENSPVILIHRINYSRNDKKSSQKIQKPEKKRFNIQIGWIIVGYPEKFEFENINKNITFKSYDFFKSPNYQHLYNIEPFFCTQDFQRTCALATCVSKSPKINSEDITSSPNTQVTTCTSSYISSENTVITGLHFSINGNSACLFAYDIENGKRCEDSDFINSLNLFSSCIDEENRCCTGIFGQTDINWNVFKSANHRPSLFKYTNRDQLLKIIKKNAIRSDIDNNMQKIFKAPMFITLHFDKCPDQCHHAIVNIGSDSILYKSLEDTVLKKEHGRVSYFLCSSEESSLEL